MKLVSSPFQLKQKWPAPSSFVETHRQITKDILIRHDPRLALIAGPCSIHDRLAALDYGKKLKELTPHLKHFFPIMRLFIEKPRTVIGWKGIVYDPFLDNSNEIDVGLETARQLWVELAELGVPCATELLDPLVVPYFNDLVVWGVIGARTSASQPHRQMVSGLPFPIGFKNDFRGEIDPAIASILASRVKHSHLSLNEEGRVCQIQTEGNPFTHLILRGSDSKTNFDAESIQMALRQLEFHELEPRLLVDCSHGNSGKEAKRQKIAFDSVINQIIEGNRGIAGLMLESQLHHGKQTMNSPLRYGVSITDSCLGWEETESLLLSADSKLSRAMS